jgi:hypothetical protein
MREAVNYLKNLGQSEDAVGEVIDNTVQYALQHMQLKVPIKIK